jgi:hypothetical protein
MTRPAPPPTASQGQQDQALALAAAEALAGATTVAAAAGVLGALFAAAGIRRAALTAALSVVMGMPPDRAGFYGPATAQVARLNLIRRAQFLIASARRMTSVLASAASHGQNPLAALAAAAGDERRWYGQHLAAGWNRQRAAAQADSAAMTWGPVLGWYATVDSRTSLECWRADRHNFRADDMPVIGFPGMVHPHCRCMPGAPFPGAPVIGAATLRARDHTGSRRQPVDHRPVIVAAVRPARG